MTTVRDDVTCKACIKHLIIYKDMPQVFKGQITVVMKEGPITFSGSVKLHKGAFTIEPEETHATTEMG
jgi:hypothetical protein